MSLQRLTCDRCQRFSGALFRLTEDMEKPAMESNWYCPNCMRLMGQPLGDDVGEMMEWLRKHFTDEPEMEL